MTLEFDRVYLGDCLDLMGEMEDNSVDLVLTDPPYGNNLGYNSYDDSQTNLIKLVNAFMPELLRISERIMLTPGVGNMYLYPKPDWVMSWVSSAGVGRGPWGFCCWQPILVYGKDPYLANRMGSRPDIFLSNEKSEKNGHPVPKPINLWMEILNRGSVFSTDLVFDPFLGSGTTAIAAIRTGRHFIGIEKDEGYFNLAKERINKAKEQDKLTTWFNL